jgi:hypothetical protein
MSTVSGLRRCSTFNTPNNTPFGEHESIAPDLTRLRKKISQKKAYLLKNNNRTTKKVVRMRHNTNLQLDLILRCSWKYAKKLPLTKKQLCVTVSPVFGRQVFNDPLNTEDFAT